MTSGPLFCGQATKCPYVPRSYEQVAVETLGWDGLDFWVSLQNAMNDFDQLLFTHNRLKALFASIILEYFLRCRPALSQQKSVILGWILGKSLEEWKQKGGRSALE